MDTSNDKMKTQVIMTDQRFHIRPIQQVVSACTGALVTACFMTPLDVVKTRLQAQYSTFATNRCFLYSNGLMDHLCTCDTATFQRQTTPQFKGTFDAFIKISRAEGIRSLWSGLAPTMVSALPSTVVYFVAYEQLRACNLKFHYKYIAVDKSSASTHDMPLYIPMLSGISARICAVTFVSPLELIRTKMQSQKMTYLQMKSAVKSILQNEGIRGLWRGLPPTILRDVPFSGIYWSCYEYLKGRFDVVEPTIGFSFIAGAVSGSIAALLTTPFDVIKTHDQIAFGEQLVYNNKSVATASQRRVLYRLQQIYEKRGLSGIFAGLGPRLFKVAPACAIMISSFEYGKSFFYHYNIRQYNELTINAGIK